ncbi:MAG TPA: hypothetical protein VM406_14360 [Noviherbaspirillum sp.]|nr:hypothetical protein [Noviherbaspirillum sp.]
MRLFKLDHLVSMIAAPIIWAAHFLICYTMVSLVCMVGWTHARLFGMNPGQIAVALATVVGVVLLGYTGVVNLEKYRQSRKDETGTIEVSGFVALNALLLSILSTVAVVWVAFPTLMLPTCAI